MHATAAAGVSIKPRSESLPNLVIATWLTAWLLSRALSLLEAAFGLHKAWQLVAYATLSAIAVAFLAAERRRLLARPAIEPGPDERSWADAAGDLLARDCLREPAALTLITLGVAAVPWAVFVWPADLSSFLRVLAGCIVLAFAVVGLVEWRARHDGLIETVPGSRAPAGWWGLAALAVGLPLVWLPVALMSAETGAWLGLLGFSLLNGLAWWWGGIGWSRPWRVDRRLRAIPLDWQWQHRKKSLASSPASTYLLGLFLVGSGWSELLEVLGSGCGVFMSWIYWWLVLFGLLWTGARVLAREVPPPAAQEPAPPSASRSA